MNKSILLLLFFPNFVFLIVKKKKIDKKIKNYKIHRYFYII